MKSRLILAALQLFSRLPLSWMRRVGGWLGTAAWLLKTRMARTTLANLRLALPELDDAERNRLARASLRNTFQTIIEAGGIWLWPAERALATIGRVNGLQLLQDAVGVGRGVLVIAPHLGNWELFGLYLNSCGCGQSHQLFQPPESVALRDVIHRARSRAGANMVPTDKQGVATLLRALKAGEIVGILPDQVPPRESGAHVPFFGVPALTMTLLTRLQQKTGAQVVVGYARRTRVGFDIEFRTPDASAYAEDMPSALRGLNASVEAVVREAPEQYQWEYKRYKRQPAGMPAPYSD